MKPIYIYAIANTNECDLKHYLIEAIRDLNDDKIERFIEIVLGCKPKYSFPPKVYNYNKTHIRKLTSVNYLDDRVDYSYEETITRFFNNQEDADEYAATGSYSFSNSKSVVSDEYNISADHTFINKSYMTITEWLNCEIVNE